MPDQGRLPGIEGAPVRRHFEQGQVDRRPLNRRAAATCCGSEEALLGVEDPLRGVEGGADDSVDRRAVDTPQLLRFLDAVVRSTARPACRPALRCRLPIGRGCGPRWPGSLSSPSVAESRSMPGSWRDRSPGLAASPDRFPADPQTALPEPREVPDKSDFIELSFKVAPDQAVDAGKAFRDMLAGRGLDTDGDQVAKTRRVLEFYTAAG